MPQVKYSNFQLYCLQICITDMKSLLFPFENVFCCTTFPRTCNGCVTTGSVEVCDVITGNRNKIYWRSKFFFVTFEGYAAQSLKKHFPLLKWWWFFVPLLFICARWLLWSTSQTPVYSKEKTNQTSSTSFASHWDGMSCSLPAKLPAATFAALSKIRAIEACL